MLKHVVMWKLVDQASAKKIKIALEKLNDLACVEKMEVAFNDKELVLYSEFKDKKNLAEYFVHPQHEKIVEFMKGKVRNRMCVDYEL